jgi:hypothetical protein
VGQYRACCLALLGADGAEDVDRGCALVSQRSRPDGDCRGFRVWLVG